MGKILVIKGADFSQVAVGTVTPVDPTGAPVITISGTGIVTITATNAASIHYTTDGSTPTTSSTQYGSAFTVESGTTVKAISVSASGTVSSVVSKTYGSLGVKTYGDTTVYKTATGYMISDEDSILTLENRTGKNAAWSIYPVVPAQADGLLTTIGMSWSKEQSAVIHVGVIDQNKSVRKFRL